MLVRPGVRGDIQLKFSEMLKAYRDDLRHATLLLVGDASIEGFCALEAIPQTAGVITWSRMIQSRIVGQYNALKALGIEVALPTEFEAAKRDVDSVVDVLKEKESRAVTSWFATIENAGNLSLKTQPLSVDADGVAKVNISPAFVSLLREVRYLLQLGIDVPDAAKAMYEKAETFRTQTGNLFLLVNAYNKMQSDLDSDVERSLLATKVEDCEGMMREGMQTLSWRERERLTEFIQLAMSKVRSVAENIRQIKHVVKEVDRIGALWAAPLFSRQDQKTYSAEELGSIALLGWDARAHTAEEDSAFIQALVADCGKSLGDTVKGRPPWREFLTFLNSRIADHLRASIVVTCDYILRQLDRNRTTADDVVPLIDVRVELLVRPAFVPSIGSGVANLLRWPGEDLPAAADRETVSGVLADTVSYCVRIADIVRPVGKGFEPFLGAVKGFGAILERVAAVDEELRRVYASAGDVIVAFNAFSGLWRRTPGEAFQVPT